MMAIAFVHDQAPLVYEFLAVGHEQVALHEQVGLVGEHVNLVMVFV